MRRMISLTLALVLALGLAVPAMAEVSEEAVDAALPEAAVDAAPAEEAGGAGMDAALAELVLRVKQTLEVDDGYTDLTNDFYDGVTPYWTLRWSDETRRLNVDVREDGTVLRVNFWDDSGEADRFYGFDPAFPAISREEAQAQAEAWFSRLFAAPESARVDRVHTVLGKDGCFRFSGTVEMNALPSPVTFELCIDETGMTSFYRSDGYGGYVGELPPAEAAVDETAGAEGLAGAAELELRWVSDGEGGAALQYVPVGPYTVVDAQSGQAVDMDALYASLGGEAGMNGLYGPRDAVAEEAMSDAADGGVSLTEMELASIESYGDVMAQDALDSSLRELAALGLEPFTMQRCSYSMDSETGRVTAAMDYTAPMTEEELYGYSAGGFALSSDMGTELVIYKYITADAKTGALRSVHTIYPLWEKDPAVTMTQAVRARAAENFLSLAAPEKATETQLCTLKGYGGGDTLIYAQVHEGYFYPDNALTVTVNPSTGTVDRFTCTWEDVTFGPAKDPVPAGEARAAYTDALDVTLGYVAWPVDITLAENEIYAGLLDLGYAYVEQLRLGYYYTGTGLVTGVDGLTGEALTAEETTDGDFVYDDLQDVPQAAQIEALAQAGIGFAGGSFRPEEALTQREAVTLLLQADGETVLPGETDDALLERAAWRGLVTKEEWDPQSAMTRQAFLRMVLGASRYGDGARLLDVGAGEGYELMAMALGMDTSEPEEPATRAAAAEMLYRFMDR